MVKALYTPGNSLHKRGCKDNILRQVKVERLLEFYLSEFESFQRLYAKVYNSNIIHQVFDTWFNASYLKITKSGRLIWKIR